MRNVLIAMIGAMIWALLVGPAWSHHSYAMFDGSKTVTVRGTIAKLEWMNPHVFVWVYVRDPAAGAGYELYAFENGSPNVLTRLGWTTSVLAAGDKVTVDFWPLKDGRRGGHFLKATLGDGRILYGAGGPNAEKGGGAETNHLQQ